MERLRRPAVWVVAAAMLLAVAPVRGQEIPKQIKDRMDQAAQLGKVQEYDKQLEVYDELMADLDAQDPVAGQIKALAVQAAAAAKQTGEVIRRGNEYLKGKLKERDRVVILLCLAHACFETRQTDQAVVAAGQVTRLETADKAAREEAEAILVEALPVLQKGGVQNIGREMQLYGNLFTNEMKSEDHKPAIATLRTMIQRIVTQYPDMPAYPRTMPADAIAELCKRGEKAEANRIAKELLDASAKPETDKELKDWCVVTAFQAYASSGESQKAIGVFNGNTPSFKIPTLDFPFVIKRAAEALSKKEVAAGKDMDDVVLALKWYSKKDPPGPFNCFGLFEAMESAYEKQGNRIAMAKMMEEMIGNLPQDFNPVEKWKYRAAEIYMDCKEPAEARRVLADLEKKWPAAHDAKAGLLLAKINTEGGNADGAIEDLRKAHSTTKDPAGWFQSGETLAGMYEKRGEWDKALALRKEMGAKDATRLVAYANQLSTQKRYADALDLYRQLRTQEPKKIGTYQGEANVLKQLNRNDEFLQVCDQVADQFPPGPEHKTMLLQAGQMRLTLYRYKEAERDYQRFLAAYPISAKGTPEEIEQEMQVYRDLCRCQVKLEERDGATATVRSMIRCVVSQYPKVSTVSRTLPADALADLCKLRDTRDANVLTKELLDTSKQPGLADEVTEWCAVTVVQAYTSSGDSRDAMKAFRENVTAFKNSPLNFASVIKQAAEGSSKKELTGGQSMTMGEETAPNVAYDVAFALKWYSKKDPPGPFNCYGLFEAVEAMYQKQGDRIAMARLMEEMVANLPQDFTPSEQWKYRAVEIYMDCKQPAEARRVLADLEKKWPAAHDAKAGLLLAKLNTEGGNVNDAIEGLRKLHATTADATGWFQSGETLAGLYEKRGEWDKALSLRKEMGAKDSRRLQIYANELSTQKRTEDTLDLYRQLRAQEPTNVRGYQGEAEMLRILKRYEESVQVYDKITSLFPAGSDHQVALIQSAQTRLVELDRPAEAERDYRRFLATYPKSEDAPMANLSLIRILHRLGKHAEVIAQGKEFLPKATIGWMATEVRQDMADAYTALGQDAEAAKILEGNK
jgi:tetratricopeptide (TPR) repeat protein